MNNRWIARTILVVAGAIMCGVLLLLAKQCASSWDRHPRKLVAGPENGLSQLPRKKFIVHSDRDHPLAALLGKNCKVQFKRNALGAGADVPVPPLTDSFNGAQVSCYGNLSAVTKEGLFLEVEGNSHLWIPMDSILLVDVQE